MKYEIINGMREYQSYNIQSDEVFIRWDMLVNGKQEINEAVVTSQELKSKIADLRNAARSKFDEMVIA